MRVFPLLQAFSDGYSAHPQSLVYALALCVHQQTSENLRVAAYNAVKTVCKVPEDFFLFIKFAYDLSQPNSGGLEWKLMKQIFFTLEDYIKMFCYLCTAFWPVLSSHHEQWGKSVLALCQYHMHHNIANACIWTILVLYSAHIPIGGRRSVSVPQIACSCNRDIWFSWTCVIDCSCDISNADTDVCNTVNSEVYHNP